MKNAFEYEAELAALREERDQWRAMVGHICATIPLADVVASTETGQKTVDYFKALQQRLADAERRKMDLVRLLTRARIYARGEFRDEIDACLAGKTAQVAVSPEPTPYQPKGEWSFERCEDGAIVIKNGKDWTLIKSGKGPIYEQFLYRFCEQQMKELTAPTINENAEFEKWRNTQIDVLVRNGYPEGAEAFRNLGSVQWAGWQARACLKELNQ